MRPLKALHMTCHSPIHTHSYTDGRSYHAGCQPAHQGEFNHRWRSNGSNLGLGVLPKDMWTGGARNRTANLPIGGGLLYLLSHSRPPCVINVSKLAKKLERLSSNWKIGGSIPGSSGPHVNVSLGKTLNPKLLPLLCQRCMNVNE